MPVSGRFVVVGAPRSGTSLVAQLLASGGVDFGSHLLAPSEANPRGFYEDVRATEVDDELLAPHVVGRGPLPVPEARLAWLGVPSADAFVASAGQRERMSAIVSGPGCRGLKDPRLVWTLDAWCPVLGPDPSFVAVVRRPDEVAASLRQMWERDRTYYGELEVTVERGLRTWIAANARLLRRLRRGRWIVVDHRDLLAGDAVGALAGFGGLTLDLGRVDATLHRSRSTEVAVPEAAATLYEHLRERARQDVERWSRRGP